MTTRKTFGTSSFVLLTVTWVLLSIFTSDSVVLASPISPETSRWAQVAEERPSESSDLVKHVHTDMEARTAIKHQRDVKTWGPPPLLVQDEANDKKDDDCIENVRDQRHEHDEDCSDDDGHRAHQAEDEDCPDDDYPDEDYPDEEDDVSRQGDPSMQEHRQQDQDVDFDGHLPRQTVNNLMHPLPSLLAPPRIGLPLRGSRKLFSEIDTNSTAPLSIKEDRTVKIGLPVDMSTEDRHADSTTNVDWHSRHADKAPVSASTGTSNRLPECTEGVFPPGNATRRSFEVQTEDLRDHMAHQPCTPPKKSTISYSRTSSRRPCRRTTSTHAPYRSSHKSHRTATATATPTGSAASHPSSWTQTMLTLADDTVLMKTEVWIPEEEAPQSSLRSLTKRSNSDDFGQKDDEVAAAVTSALKAFLEQEEVRHYLLLPHYIFIVSPDDATGKVNISTVYFRPEEQVTHRQLHRASTAAASGAPWPRWPGPRHRVETTADVTWYVLHIIPVLLLIFMRTTYSGRLERMLVLATLLLFLCDWLILMDHNTKRFFDVSIDDPKEGLWYLLYYSEWTLALIFAPYLYHWMDKCTGGRLHALLRRRIIPAGVWLMARGTPTQALRARRPIPHRRNASDSHTFFTDLELVRRDASASTIPCETAIPLDPMGPAEVIVSGEEEQGTHGRARRAARTGA
ncbi:hypothetical protein BCV69DRAFT_298773 [Microstroma glucosiphilum]|uniref:Uncharacterized protein n=1 Tax=Pseudomicrostroma glucosiphilum TaxID=1684307 RepID=A0A316U811_9BASI|nr:hypothetical protein BCV69DRAFT_298773 [Pseudomicrostroma glucosiphilum]PWN20978.1 hypothetical protein BCV69DRAFT_298773 [Pseudomicrostroma glucosiphilum]